MTLSPIRRVRRAHVFSRSVELDLHDGPAHLAVGDGDAPAGQVSAHEHRALLVGRTHPTGERAGTPAGDRHEPSLGTPPVPRLGEWPVDPRRRHLEHERSRDRVRVAVQGGADDAADLSHRVKIDTAVAIDHDPNDAAAPGPADRDVLELGAGSGDDGRQQPDQGLPWEPPWPGTRQLLSRLARCTNQRHVGISGRRQVSQAAYVRGCARLGIVAGQIRVSRRFVTGAGGLAGVAGLLGLASAGCDSSGPAGTPSASRSTGSAPRPTADPAAAADERLRVRAIAAESRLLAAAAAPNAAEPFATIRALHRQHLRVLTGRLPADPAPAAAPAAAALATAERAVAAARRSDCTAASPALAPLLASLSASADVAVTLLGPQLS